MSTTIEIRSAPHIKTQRSVEQIMRNVVGSLLPVCAFFVYQYGLSALASLVVVTAACLATERFFVKTGTQSGTLADWSAVITGLLLALSLPPGFPLWMGAVAGIVAIALGKALFGGIGFNVFNPALVGRAFVQAAFPVAIATYTPSFLDGRFTSFVPSTLAWPLMMPADTAAWLQSLHLDGITGATPLAKWKFEGVAADPLHLLSSLSGHMAVGPSPLLILVCGAYLAVRRFLDWRIPAAILGSAGLTAFALYAWNPARFPDPFFMMFSGGLMLGAIYMATDMATSPVTPRGMWVYGGLIGVLTVLIRYYGGLPEGVMYAILIGNAASPLIERFTQPRPFGKSGLLRPRRGASYALHPEYISREEAGATTPKKRMPINKPRK
ncbi:MULTISPECIES: RnfABCDGE type electron transport complex subunit D [unclassified Rubrivivax]|uniref:RnfABCDGE type electron transport complex subunit D n=1 Tax=unclassified Rubrivivax TaxID=2649762 RepID=UPI001E306959|nr:MULTISPECIES: RnfABCDGE type electron transport complex subunit D [unclassified Rubrivivax]MCC9597164.1 RnfABCDGE type electron transport complex subunit D [Rubrivivax sp. JA1055]MCC9646577.1 RnfABCDGE type electron transport complex subunit D [Rubrivivax sp. JA1029]